MKPRHIFFAGCLCASGCSLIWSTEQFNALAHTPEERMQMFKEYQDREIGEPYYFYEPEDLWCQKFTCARVGPSAVEYIPRTDPSKQCVVAWTVDDSKKGKYHHPNGQLFDIAGLKRSWRYVSKPELCLFTMNYYGPW